MLLLALAGAAEADAGLLGSWRVVSMSRGGQTKKVPDDRKATLEFKKGGVFVTHVEFKGRKRSDKGSWSAKGDKLTTKHRRGTETVSFKISGSKLVLTHPKHKGKMNLVRVK
ncbi:MAG: lipocalin family protein [Myxococcales bacterium]|nr:lipocalin family protein [Myxococcales bacterium]